jgi:hypothetical protein
MTTEATPLGAFNNMLIRFLEQLVDTYPEERDIAMGLEAIQGAKKINPKLILDLFYEYVFRDAHQFIMVEDDVNLIEYARKVIQGQFNEMSSALIIFDKHWETMSESNRQSVWKYMKVLCVLCARAKGITSFVDPAKRTPA